MNLLFVCSGNTCRSPMAAALCRVLRPQDRALSAGLFAAAGSPATPEAAAAVRPYGAQLDGHRAQPITRELLDQADFVITMTRQHQRMLAPFCPAEKLFTLGDLSNGEDVADPYGGGADVYRACAEQLYQMLQNLKFPETAETPSDSEN